ncbi:unnamed protein product [Paramecium pentaurelia]|uniref:Uncharacterized protein n=1 Tax=Paramecium pentaurelia TaxID=43138 RepID=A0A8S1XA93_9CILI|nr:unnamed protein product [Paramecium pentaurelia]
MLTMNSLLEHNDVCSTLDNQAIFDICRRQLDIEKRKLVPYLPNNFLLCSYATFITIDKSKVVYFTLQNSQMQSLSQIWKIYGMLCIFRGDVSMMRLVEQHLHYNKKRQFNLQTGVQDQSHFVQTK